MQGRFVTKNIKQINNPLCGRFSCNKPGKTRIIFELDFSAYFCEECASGLVNEGIGIKERRAEKVLGSIGDAHSNAPIKSSTPSSKEIDQRR
jgi:hypothetical protein